MIDGSFGSNTSGVSQLRRSEVVAPMVVLVLPAFVERRQFPNWEQPYTKFWSVGSISVYSPSPQPP
jgi:hypothetical protein